MSEISHKADQAYIMPTPEQLASARAIVGRFAESWDNPQAEALRDLMHPDTKNLIPPMTEPADREGVVAHFRGVLERLPDLRIAVVRWAPTGDAVMIEWQATATVAGQVLTWEGVDRFNVYGDRIYQGSVYWDTRGLAERMAAAVQAIQKL